MTQLTQEVPETANKDRQVRAIQEREMPEGDPPPAQTRRREWKVAGVCLVVLTIATLGVLLMLDGTAAVVLGVGMLLAYITLGGAAAIFASLERQRVRREIEERLRK